jgi:tight adherence protein B
MKRSFVVTLGALLIALVVPIMPGIAQEDPAEVRIDQVDVSDYPELHFSVQVPAAQGPLPSDAFRVSEDGGFRPADVQFAASSDLQVVMLVDTTGSMSGAPLTGAKQAATTFITDLPDDVGISIVNYDTDAEVVTGFGASREEHIAGIDELVAGGYTAMYDAVRSAVELFPEAGEETSRVVVLMTDGEDNTSDSTVEEAIEELTEADITLHSIEYLTDSGEEAAIRSMAEATGGTVLEANNAEALTSVYQALAAELVSRYTVRYTSESNGLIELSVTVEDGARIVNGTTTVELPEPAASAEEPEEASPSVTAPPIIPPAATSNTGLVSLIIGSVLWFVALAVTLLVLFAPRRRESQLAGAASGPSSRQRGMSELANRATMFADRNLERRGHRNSLNAALERAGIELRPGEFVVLVTSAAVIAFAVGRLLSGWFAALLFAIVVVIVARLAVSFMTSRRQKRFADQLGETLQLLSGSLRAGYSLMQAVDAVAREADSPAAEEFGRLVVETRLGRDMEDALHAIAARMQCEDFTWVMQAIEIHREVGGDLAEVLDTVAGTIRERNQIRRQVQALSAEGKLSAYVLLALPFGIGIMIYLTNRPYLAELTNGGLLGWGLIGLGVLLMTVGVVWMRKLVKLVF